MQRVPEPELMNGWEQACAYADADFSEPHDYFIRLFHQTFGNIKQDAIVLDLGCGPADISRRFAQAYPDCYIHGVDAAPNMLALGHAANLQAGLIGRIELIHQHLPCASLPNESYDVIICNSLLHHLSDPSVLWRSLFQFGHTGTAVFIMDLLRPASTEQAKRLVECYADNEPDVLRADFYASLCAAFTENEVHDQLAQASLTQLQIRKVSDRHLIIYGYLT